LRLSARLKTCPGPRRLPALEALDQLLLTLCRHTRRFPALDPADLGLGMRSAALTAAEAVVAGLADGGLAEQLLIAARRLREVGFYIEVTRRLGFLSPATAATLLAHQQRASGEVAGLAWSPPTGRPLP
jgi:hypothetical protein